MSAAVTTIADAVALLCGIGGIVLFLRFLMITEDDA